MITIPDGQPGAGGYREHDILVIREDGTAENITKYPFGPEYNVVWMLQLTVIHYNTNWAIFHRLRILKLFAQHKIFIYVFQLTDQFEF